MRCISNYSVTSSLGGNPLCIVSLIVVGISSRIARNTDAGKVEVDVKMNPLYTALSCQAVLGTHGYVPGMSASELGHWWGRDSL